MLSCMPCTRMCREHAHAALPQRFLTAHSYTACAASSDPAAIGEGLWAPFVFGIGSPLWIELHLSSRFRSGQLFSHK